MVSVHDFHTSQYMSLFAPTHSPLALASPPPTHTHTHTQTHTHNTLTHLCEAQCWRQGELVSVSHFPPPPPPQNFRGLWRMTLTLTSG